MKRKLMIGAIFAMLLSLSAYGTVAYFTAEKVARNVITTGDVRIKLIQDTAVNGTGGDEIAMPGDRVTNRISVKNTGKNDAYVRVRIACEVRKEGKVIPTEEGMLTWGTDDVHWKDGGDGYYYFKRVLKPGETTEPLMDRISLSLAMGNEFRNSDVKVDVVAFGVQAIHNGRTVFEATGWPEA